MRSILILFWICVNHSIISHRFQNWFGLLCGAPQFFSTLYPTTLDSVISKNSTKYHFYAGYTLLYISSNSTTSLTIFFNTQWHPTFSGRTWTNCFSNRLNLIFFSFGTKQRLIFPQLTTLSVGNGIILVSSSAGNIGSIFDSNMSFARPNQILVWSLQFYIRYIQRLRHILPLSAANSLVSRELDHCNSLNNCSPRTNLYKIRTAHSKYTGSCLKKL